MVGPDKPNPKGFINKLRERTEHNQFFEFAWDHALEIISAAAVLIGIVLTFFYIHVGAALVGLGIGLCFYQEICSILAHAGGYYTNLGLLKTLILIGMLLFFLIAIPSFIIILALVCAIMFLIRWTFKT